MALLYQDFNNKEFDTIEAGMPWIVDKVTGTVDTDTGTDARGLSSRDSKSYN